MNKWEQISCKKDAPPFVILYEDDCVLVCKKAPGVPVQSASVRTPDLECMLKLHLQQQQLSSDYLGIVHRLDQPVQGLLVFAKTQEAAASLSRQAQNGQMKKCYCCVCNLTGKGAADSWKAEQEPEETEVHTLTDYLVRDGRTNTSRVVSERTKGAKKAVLTYRVLERSSGQCLLHVELKTGRHHQIRVQLAHAGMPIDGDRKYGNGEDQTAGPLKLCAYRLGFIHPKTGESFLFSLEDPSANKS